MMNMDCETCKMNGEQPFYRCGYIKEEKRNGPEIDFPVLKNPDFLIRKCPTWYYYKYRYFYDFYNFIKKSAKDLTKLNFGQRIVISEFDYYLSLKHEFEMKKILEKKKRGLNG